MGLWVKYWIYERELRDSFFGLKIARRDYIRRETQPDRDKQWGGVFFGLYFRVGGGVIEYQYNQVQYDDG